MLAWEIKITGYPKLVARTQDHTGSSGKESGFCVDVGLDKEKLQRGIFAGTVRIRTDDNDFQS